MHRQAKGRIWLLMTLLFAMGAMADSGAEAEGTKYVSESMLINAKPERVWNSIRRLRKSDPKKRRLISYDGKEAIIEETFAQLPVLGSASCLYKECEIPVERIEYSLVKSKQFKAFQGRWELTPLDHGNSTMLRLSSFIDPSVWVPFKEKLTHITLLKDVQKRLEAVKSDAEISK